MQVTDTSGAVVMAAAQSRSVAGDISANVQRHLRYMELASERGVGFLLFPELSLTGYEPALASELAMTEDDSRLQPLRDMALKTGITTAVGAPVRSFNGELLIAAFIFHGNGAQSVQSKQHLHGGEESVFAPGAGGVPIDIGGERLSLAICADFSHARHAHQAAQAGATVYVVSALISGTGYGHDASVLKGYARQHRMAVLMANYAGMTGGWSSGGRSALWNEHGETEAEIPNAEEGLLVVQRSESGWTSAVHAVSF